MNIRAHDKELMIYSLIVVSSLILGFLYIIKLYQYNSLFTYLIRYILWPAIFLLFAIKFSKNYRLFCGSYWSKSINLLWLAFFYFILISFLKFKKIITNHYDFFDAGLYINKLNRLYYSDSDIFWRLVFSDGHFQPINAIFVLFYKITNYVYIPFFIESLIISSGILPIYLLSMRKLNNSSLSLVISSAYLLNPLVQFNDILGFHPDHIVLPSLLWAFYFADRKLILPCFASLLILCCASEPWIIMVSFFGIYVILEYKYYIFGSIIFLSSALLFFYITFFYLPFYSSHNAGPIVFGSDGPYFIFLTGSFGDIFNLLFTTRKFFFLFFLFLPFLFLPLAAWRVMVVAIPEIAKTLFSSEPLHYAVEGHYTLGLIAVMFVGYIFIIKKIYLNYPVIANRLITILFFLSFALSISHGPTPISVNFWANTSSGSFNYRNYLFDSRSASLSIASSYLPLNHDYKLQISNNTYANSFGLVKDIKLFPETGWQNSDYILLSKATNQTTGAVAILERYNVNFNLAKNELPKFFVVIYDDDYLTLWKNNRLMNGN